MRRSASRNCGARRVTRPASSIAPASQARAGSWKIVRPTAKPRQVRLPAASAKPARKRVDRRTQPQQHDAAAVRVALGDQRVDRLPLRRGRWRELPPLGKDAEVVEPFHRAQQNLRFRQKNVSAARSRSAARARSPAPHRTARFTCASCSSRFATSSSGWNGTRHLTTCSTGQATSVVPIERPRSNDDRIRPGQFDRPAHPPAASGRRVERILAVAIVAQDARRDRRGRAPLRSARRHRQTAASAPAAAFAGTRGLRQIEELVAMVEGEQAQLGPRCARRSHAVQPRERLVPVRPGNTSPHARGSSRARRAWASPARSRAAIRPARRRRWHSGEQSS